MKRKKKFLIFASIIILLLTLFLTKQFSISFKSYKSEIFGEVKDIRNVGRGDAYVQLKFKNAVKFNELSVLYVGADNQKDIKIGDSIYKSQNSYEYKIYRKDS